MDGEQCSSAQSVMENELQSPVAKRYCVILADDELRYNARQVGRVRKVSGWEKFKLKARNNRSKFLWQVRFTPMFGV